jgi:hypothetical protein
MIAPVVAPPGIDPRDGTVIRACLVHFRLTWDRRTSPPASTLERPNKEVKRRSDVVGIFPNEVSIIHLVGGSRLRGDYTARPAQFPPPRWTSSSRMTTAGG